MPLNRVRVSWSGFPGANGVSTLHFSASPPPLAELRQFLVVAAASMPADVTMTIANDGDILDPITGLVTGVWTAAAVATIPGTAGGVYSAPSGAVVNWGTGGVIDGRRLRGKTFLVPLSAAAYDVGGSIEPGALNALRLAASAFAANASPSFCIWHRPFAGSPAWTDVHGRLHPAKPARVGGFQPVNSAAIPDKCVILRSRRD